VYEEKENKEKWDGGLGRHYGRYCGHWSTVLWGRRRPPVGKKMGYEEKKERNVFRSRGRRI